MVLRQIRQHKKKMTVPLILLTIILAVGLVGSFAIWSSPDLSNTTGKPKTLTSEEQITYLQTSITSLETALKTNSKDFATLSGLADAQYQQGQLYYKLKKLDLAKAVIGKSMQNYLLSLDNAPKELNAKGQADIVVKIANAAWYSGQTSTADAMFLQAVQLVPEDISVLYQYVIYLAINKQEFAQAKQVLATYRAKLPAGDSRIANVDSMIKSIGEIQKAAVSSAAKTDTGTTTTPPADKSNSTTTTP